MRLHVLGLPWTETTRTYLHCAYTEKVRKFCTMMTREGWEVILYAGAENEGLCHEHVPLVSAEERIAWFGEWDPNNLFEKIDWDPASPWWQAFNARAIAAVQERSSPRDILCLVTRTQEVVSHALPSLLPVEWAVGYEGIRADPYPSGTPPLRVFESYAWMHFLYGKYGINDGPAFDAVIPNYFDRDDFPAGRARDQGDYLLFIGRLVQRKGPQIAAAIAERLGMRLLVAGPGVRESGPGRIVMSSGEGEIRGSTLECVGPVGVEARAKLMREAVATIVPTIYVEPFGGVAVEAMMAGCPVVASDWGAFTETVKEGVGGYRFRTLAEGCTAVERAALLPRGKVRRYALDTYSLEAVGPRFTEHFHRISNLWGEGWYT